MRSSSISVGATKVPSRGRAGIVRAPGARRCGRARASRRCGASMPRAPRRRSPGRRRSRARRVAEPAARPSRPCSIATMRSAPSSCTQSTRSAEQRWPALSNADATTSRDDLLGERRRVDDHRVLAAGLGDQRHRPAVSLERASARRLLQQARDLGRAGEHARRARADRRPAPRRPSRRARAAAAARARGTPACVQQAHRLGGDQRRLLGRLGEHRVAGGERRGDLAGEDRERKIPRADADDRAERHVRRRRRTRAATCAA